LLFFSSGDWSFAEVYHCTLVLENFIFPACSLSDGAFHLSFGNPLVFLTFAGVLSSTLPPHMAQFFCFFYHTEAIYHATLAEFLHAIRFS